MDPNGGFPIRGEKKKQHLVQIEAYEMMAPSFSVCGSVWRDRGICSTGQLQIANHWQIAHSLASIFGRGPHVASPPRKLITWVNLRL